MENISLKDREILRELAARKAALATSARNDEILKMWDNQAKGVRDTPTVRMLFSNFTREVIDSRMRCEGKTAQNIERKLLWSMVGRELFDDDTPVSSTFDVNMFAKVSPFGTPPNIVHAKDSIGYHIEPMTDDIEADIDIFKGGSFWVDLEGTKAYCDTADSVFGDILPSKISMASLTGALTSPIVMLANMETFYMSMYDSPEALHEIMDMATRVYEDKEVIELQNTIPEKVEYEEKIVYLHDAIYMLTDDEIPAKIKNELLKQFIEKIEFSRENNDEFVLDIYLQ